MKHSAEIAHLAAALVKAQAELRSISTDAKNRFDKKYVSLDAMTEYVRPILAKSGLAVIQGATLPVSDAEGRLTAFTLETMLVHESGEWLINGVIFPVGTTPEKDKAGNVVGREARGADAAAAITYGRRYGLASLLVLTTGDDEDAGNRQQQPQSERRPARKAVKSGGYNDTSAPAQPKPAPAAPATPARKAADRTLPTPNGPRRLGDFSDPELVSLKGRALEAGKQDLADAISEVQAERFP